MLNLKDSALLRQRCYIDGRWADAETAETISVNNPATGEIIGTIPKMGAAETARAAPDGYNLGMALELIYVHIQSTTCLGLIHYPIYLQLFQKEGHI